MAYIVRFLPVATLGLYAMQKHAYCGRDAAGAVHGVKPWRRAIFIDWPRWREPVFAVTVLCALFIATELEMSILLAAPGQATLGIRLYTLIHTAPESMVSSLTLGIVCVIGPGVVLLGILLSMVARGQRNRYQ